MHLAGIKISNLFSFPYISDFFDAPEVTFHNDKLANVNLLIGPNGSGKSNFLDILHYILKNVFFRPYMIDESVLASGSSFEKAIIPASQSTIHLSSHKSFFFFFSEIHIRLTLTDHDYDNIRFFLTHSAEIQELITTYSTQEVLF